MGRSAKLSGAVRVRHGSDPVEVQSRKSRKRVESVSFITHRENGLVSWCMCVWSSTNFLWDLGKDLKLGPATRLPWPCRSRWKVRPSNIQICDSVDPKRDLATVSCKDSRITNMCPMMSIGQNVERRLQPAKMHFLFDRYKSTWKWRGF